MRKLFLERKDIWNRNLSVELPFVASGWLIHLGGLIWINIVWWHDPFFSRCSVLRTRWIPAHWYQIIIPSYQIILITYIYIYRHQKVPSIAFLARISESKQLTWPGRGPSNDCCRKIYRSPWPNSFPMRRIDEQKMHRAGVDKSRVITGTSWATSNRQA